MKCNEVQWILDEHGLDSLTAAQRRTFDAHLADCSRCYAEVSVGRMLANEAAPSVPDGMLERVTRALPDESRPAVTARAPFAWQLGGGLAAMAVVVLVAYFGISGSEREELSPVLQIETAADADSIGEAAPLTVLPAAAFTEGEHFVALPAVGRLADIGDRVSAWIYFMWSCLPCYELEPALSAWFAGLDPEAVDAARVPVLWNDYAELHARAFYTATQLGMSAVVSDAFFESIHENGIYLDTAEAIRQLFVELGVDGESFDAAFRSSEVDDLMSLARFNAAEARIDATPTIVIGGVYKTSPAMAGSVEGMLEVADWLIGEVGGSAQQKPACPLQDNRALAC